MSKSEEIIEVSRELGVACDLMEEKQAVNYIPKVLEKFKPFKVTGHLQIGDNAISLPIEENEFSYSKKLDSEMACMFFEQNFSERNVVLMIENAKLVCHVMENCSGIEYFLSNDRIEYLIAVNWYSVHVAGTVRGRFEQ